MSLVQLSADEVWVVEQLRLIAHAHHGHGHGDLHVKVEDGRITRNKREHSELSPSTIALQARARKNP